MCSGLFIILESRHRKTLKNDHQLCNISMMEPQQVEVPASPPSAAVQVLSLQVLQHLLPKITNIQSCTLLMQRYDSEMNLLEKAEECIHNLKAVSQRMDKLQEETRNCTLEKKNLQDELKIHHTGEKEVAASENDVSVLNSCGCDMGEQRQIKSSRIRELHSEHGISNEKLQETKNNDGKEMKNLIKLFEKQRKEGLAIKVELLNERHQVIDLRVQLEQAIRRMVDLEFDVKFCKKGSIDSIHLYAFEQVNHLKNKTRKFEAAVDNIRTLEKKVEEIQAKLQCGDNTLQKSVRPDFIIECNGTAGGNKFCVKEGESLECLLKYTLFQMLDLGKELNTSKEIYQEISFELEEELITGDNFEDRINQLNLDLNKCKIDVKDLGHGEDLNISTNNTAECNDVNETLIALLEANLKAKEQEIYELKEKLSEENEYIGLFDVNDVDRKGYTKLHRASGRCSLKDAKLLVDRGADIRKRTTDEWGTTAVHMSAAANCIDLTEWFIKRVPVDIKTKYGATPLHSAVGFRAFDTAKLLLDHGANIEARESGLSRETPLHFAARVGDLAIVKLLIEYGADTTAHNLHFETPAQLASPEVARVISSSKTK
ncbi:uncharacterized protein [Periplaneta americana]|uniref:uncharacterized protein n=1 Tax=Periplaneta americana TaxID=6978 RepID=UPI0037E75A38